MLGTHSAGPWKHDGDWLMSLGDERGPMPLAQIDYACETRDVANKALIEAAPDLWEACNDAIEGITCFCNQRPSPQSSCDCWACKTALKIRSALNKARGW